MGGRGPVLNGYYYRLEGYEGLHRLPDPMGPQQSKAPQPTYALVLPGRFPPTCAELYPGGGGGGRIKGDLF
jgi:hypothetical protein